MEIETETQEADEGEFIELMGRQAKFKVLRDARGTPLSLHGKRAVYTLRVSHPQYEPDTYLLFQSNGKQLRERRKDGSFVAVTLRRVGSTLVYTPPPAVEA